MIDFNDPNFLLADSDPRKDDEFNRTLMSTHKKRVREALAIGLVFLIIWGATIIAVIASLGD